jgi:hypothetical protein
VCVCVCYVLAFNPFLSEYIISIAANLLNMDVRKMTNADMALISSKCSVTSIAQ